MTSAAPLKFGQAVSLVAEREIRMRLRSKAFLISTGILLLVVLASILIGGFASKSSSDIPVAVVGGAIGEVSGLEITDVATLDEAETLVRDGDVDAAIVSASEADSPTGVEVVALDAAPSGVIGLLSQAPTVRLLDENAQNPGLLYLVAVAFGVVFFMSAITFGSTIAQSVVEEKQTRVVELLMSAIPVRALLAGKVVGNSIMAFAQIVVIALLSTVGLLVSGQDVLLAQIGPPVIWFVVFFAIGFVLLASLFAATAALVSRQEDVASVTSPVTMLVGIPYFLVIFFNNNDLVLTIMSYVPFSAPIGMPMRIFTGDAAWWEPILSLVVIVVTTVFVVGLGARVYANSLLKMGSRVKLSEALKG
jgi:ABC-2 type transport system permease protein